MIVPVTTSTGRVIHVCTDNEPVFQSGEIMAMSKAGMLPAEAEMIAFIKETFPGSYLEKIETPDGVYITGRGDSQMAFLGFNVDEAPDTQDFGVIPAGDYTAMITGSELVSNKAGTGSFLKLELTLADGKFAGRKLFENLNLDNPSAQAVEIARGTLKKIAIACGKVSGLVNESEELHDIPMIVNVGIEKRKDTGEDSNRIKGYRSLTAAPAARPAAAPAKPSAPAAAQTPPPKPAAGAPAWAR